MTRNLQVVEKIGSRAIFQLLVKFWLNQRICRHAVIEASLQVLPGSLVRLFLLQGPPLLSAISSCCRLPPRWQEGRRNRSTNAGPRSRWHVISYKSVSLPQLSLLRFGP
jgi:hypothetical protein